MINKTITTLTITFLAATAALVAASLLHIVRVDIATAYSLFTLAAALEITRNQMLDWTSPQLSVKRVVSLQSALNEVEGETLKKAA